MKHALLITAAIVAAAAGLLILIISKCATTPAIVAGSGLVVLSLAIAIPARLERAERTIAGFALIARGPRRPRR